MQLEVILLLCIFVTFQPFILPTFQTLITQIAQLAVLGFYIGIVLCIQVCFWSVLYLLVVKVLQVSSFLPRWIGVCCSMCQDHISPCSLRDVVVSLILETGINIPVRAWNYAFPAVNAQNLESRSVHFLTRRSLFSPCSKCQRRPDAGDAMHDNGTSLTSALQLVNPGFPYFVFFLGAAYTEGFRGWFPIIGGSMGAILLNKHETKGVWRLSITIIAIVSFLGGFALSTINSDFDLITATSKILLSVTSGFVCGLLGSLGTIIARKFGIAFFVAYAILVGSFVGNYNSETKLTYYSILAGTFYGII